MTKEVQDMAKLMQIIQGQHPQTKTEEVDSMKEILERFYAATASTVELLTDRAEHDRELKEALTTEATPHGARIGSWEIMVKSGENNIKTYDVSHVQTKEPIATDLTLYEAAYGLVRLLNDGVTINTPKVREILMLENEYAKNWSDAAQFLTRQKSAHKKGDGERAAIMEDRYDEAKRKAILARERLRSLTGIRESYK